MRQRGTKTVIGGLAACLVGGCGSSSDPALGSGGPLDRTREVARAAGAAGAAGQGEVDRLIGALDSDDAAERMLAITALERETGETFGYDFAAPRAERTAAIGRWLEWRRAGHAEGRTTRSRGSGEAPARGRGMGDGA